MSAGCPADTLGRRVVLVTGLSGAGKSSILRTLEDLGYEAVDNMPLRLICELVARGDRPLAVGIDARTRDFNVEDALATLSELRTDARLRPELIYAWADEATLLRRFTQTRRRHPLAPSGRIADGIAAEERLTARLRQVADLVLDSSGLNPAALRRAIEERCGTGQANVALSVSLVSFAFPAGLPREADMVFDARFLRNPHYDDALRPHTGREPAVGKYIEADPDFAAFYRQVTGLVELVLPRFVQEGKKYATVAIGCTGGRHRSVHIVERMAGDLRLAGWHVTATHRELALIPARGDERAVAGGIAVRAGRSSVQAQEA